MNVNIEYCDPFDERTENLWMKVEHCGRYLWAADYLKNANCKYVADISCANGYGSRLLANELEYVVGIDRSTDYLSIAKGYGSGNVDYICLDLDQSPLLTVVNNIDAIVCFETLEHLLNPAFTLENFYLSLRADGILLLSVPNELYEQLDEFGNNRDPFHLHIFSQNKLIKLLECSGFEIVDILGQDICNRVVSRISELDDMGIISKDSFKQIWSYDSRTILILSRIFGFPEPQNIECSYSHIYICKKH